MRISIKRIDRSLPLPQYQSLGAAGFDIYAREEVRVEPGQLVRVPTNLIVKTPKGYFLMLTLRSSTPKKKLGLVVPHGVGVLDSDYCGPEDEVLIQVLNTSDRALVVERGERFAQGVFVKMQQVSFREVETMRSVSRGGFGSTGG